MLDNIARSGSWDDPNTGRPWSPSAQEVLNPVLEIIGTMEGELKEQKSLNTGIMTNHTESVKACNTALANALNTIVTPAMNTMKSARTTHSTCRTAEDGKIQSMESNCQTFDNSQKTTCNKEQDWFAQADNDPDCADGSLCNLIEKAVVCRTQIGEATSKANECDTAQETFKGDWCAYSSALETACSDHDDCYNTNSQNWQDAETSIQKLEEEQKIIYRMLGRIRCYLNLLQTKAAGGPAPTQADINNCQASTVTDEPLDIEYGAVEARPQCKEAPGFKDERVENKPGQDGAAWYNKEFSTMTKHGKLNADSAC